MLNYIKNLLIYLKKNPFQLIYFSFFSFILFSIPFAFSPDTRSVFEIHKLTILRVSTIIIFTTYIYECLFTANISSHDYSLFGVKWKKTYFEFPLLFILLSLLISTIFSENIRISLVGTYDRWEGLWTSINYMILFFLSIITLKSTHIRIALFTLLICSASFATFYGIFQSLGLDNTNWSMNPISRVFATINNPVHFCAYMAMAIPLFIPITLLSQQSLNSRYTFIIYSLCGLCFYAMILSYSRAAWLGFSSSFSILYLFSHIKLNSISYNYLLKQFFSSLLLCASMYLIFVFNFHLKSSYILTFTTLFFVTSLFILIYNESKYTNKVLQLSSIIHTLFIPICFAAYYLLHLININSQFVSLIQLFSLILIYLYTLNYTVKLPFFALCNSILLLFIHFISIGHSLFSLLAMILCTLIFYQTLTNSKNASTIQTAHSDTQKSLFNYLILFSSILLLTTLGIQTIQNITQHNIASVNNINYRVNSLRETAIAGSARTSMWKSSFPWIKDYFWIGSGLDTVKYKFSTYRRPEYGLLEGGHNFTPDRLHNDYLDKFVTRGILGVVSYYIFFFGVWILLLLRACNRQSNSLLILSCLAATMSFQAQSLFNFGVVPTFTILFIIMGFGASFALPILKDHQHPENIND